MFTGETRQNGKSFERVRVFLYEILSGVLTWAAWMQGD